MMLQHDHQYWMNVAFREAEKAYAEGEVPIGAIVVFENRVIGKGYNLTEKLQDPTAHAEMLAITAAADYLGSRRLTDTVLYTTMEPCVMCSGAIILSRIPLLVYGAGDPKGGACGSLYNIPEDNLLNHKTSAIAGVLENKCALIVSDFFRKLRETS